MALKELRFFISVRVPRLRLSAGRTDRFTSHRREPSCILQSDTPRYCSVSLQLFQIGDHLVGGAEVRLGDNLDEGHAAAVVV